MGRSDDGGGRKTKLSGHGSLTKAGKVREHTPERGVKTVHHRKKQGPKMDNRKQYEIVEERARHERRY